jgi:hypothetical protein
MGWVTEIGSFVLRQAAGLLTTPDDLHILTVSLDVEDFKRGAGVVFELEINPQLKAAPQRSIAKWTFPTSRLAIPDKLKPGQQKLSPPPSLPSELVSQLQTYLPEKEDVPLWIKFGPLAGYLRLASWEALLWSALNRPILRLIDLESPPPRELDATLDVVLCASEPAAKSPFSVVDVLPAIVKGILAAEARDKVVIHVFADGAHYGELMQRLDDGDRVRVYKPPQTARNRPGAGGRTLPPDINNAWLEWIAQSLTRPVDVVHFVCHGYLAPEQGWVAVAESPSMNTDQEWSRFIGSAELDSFLVHVGAWSVAFSSPPGNFSPEGLRLLVHQISEDGGRSTLLHDLAEDQECAQLTKAYRFLYHPGANVAPDGAGLSIYCHPSAVKASTAASHFVRGVTMALPNSFGFTVPEDVTEAVAAGVENALRKFHEKGEIPPWLATTQRFVEQRKLELRRLEREVDPNARDQLQQIEQAKAVLIKIEGTVVRLASERS